MWKQIMRRAHIYTFKKIRVLQFSFLCVAIWFFFWAHINEMVVWNKSLIESIQSSTLNVLLYSISILALIYLELKARRSVSQATTTNPSPRSIENLKKTIPRISKETEPAKVQSLVEYLQLLQSENKALKQELLRYRRIPSSKIGYTLLIFGALVLVASFVATSVVLAFIGLGLTFWGALFLFAKPIRFVRSTLLDSTALSSYTTIDRIIDDLNYKGKPTYIPPYPKEAYLPEYLKGLKEMIVFVPAKDISTIPTIEEIARKQFLVKNPKGICITPPGFGLASLLEKELRVGSTKMDLDGLYSSLSTVIVNNLGLASNFEIDGEKELVHVKITDSVYKDLYSIEYKLKSVHSVGCPLTSAFACLLAKTTGKVVTITKSNISPDLESIEAWYQTVEG